MELERLQDQYRESIVTETVETSSEQEEDSSTMDGESMEAMVRAAFENLGN
jgi:hypothetical protein